MILKMSVEAKKRGCQLTVVIGRMVRHILNNINHKFDFKGRTTKK